MTNGKIIAIDARMIEMSGIGTYIQHLMGQGIYDYALGDEKIIRKYDSDVRVIPFDAQIYKLKEQLCFPNRAVIGSEIDLIHFPHYNVPLSYKGRYIVTVHDLTHVVLPDFLGNKIKQWYSKRLMAHALNGSEHIFTVSENSKEDIVRYFDIDRRKISITYDAVDDLFKEKDMNDVSYLYERFNIPKGRKLISYVGNLKPHKNLDTLMRAFANLIGGGYYRYRTFIGREGLYKLQYS